MTKVHTSHTPHWWDSHAPSDKPEKFQFSFAAREVDELVIKVWDQDAFSADDVLGEATIPISLISQHNETGLRIDKESLRVPAGFSKNTHGHKTLQGYLTLVLRYEARPFRQPQVCI